MRSLYNIIHLHVIIARNKIEMDVVNSSGTYYNTVRIVCCGENNLGQVRHSFGVAYVASKTFLASQEVVL